MHNLSDDQRVKRFFFRLDEPLRGIPAPERAELHTELRQHLETLVATHLELGASPEEAIEAALRSFGDPAIVGRKLMREWRLKNRDPFWATVAAIGVFQLVLGSALQILLAWRFHYYGHGAIDTHVAQMYNLGVSLIPLLGGIVVGLRLPDRVISAAFFVGFIASVNGLVWFFINAAETHTWMLPHWGVSGMGCLAAYVVSSIKRRDWTLQIR